MKHLIITAACLLSASAFAAEPRTYTVDISMTTAAGLSTPRVQVKEGESFKVAIGEEDARVSASFTITAMPPTSVKLSGSVRCADGAAATPTLIARLGESAKVTVSGPADTRCDLSMTVREETQPASAK